MPPFTPKQLSLLVKQKAKELGFDLVGVAPAKTPPTYPHFLRWLKQSFHGTMSYMEKSREKRREPQMLLPDTKSVIVGAISYFVQERKCAEVQEPKETPPLGSVARYAWGADYHEILEGKLMALLDFLRELLGDWVKGKACVDTSPILERDFATQAGLGWIGKNTCLINPNSGSFLFLGELLVNVELMPDEPFSRNHCGKCTRCISACPTAALVAPYQLDARLCISYLTIELRGSIPRRLRPLIGNWVFGCDICQEVCPWNSKAKLTDEEGFKASPFAKPELLEILSLTEEQFLNRFRKSPIKRAKRSGLIRNACVAIGNLGEVKAVPLLIKLLFNDPDPVVREHAAWALGSIANSEAMQALADALKIETDAIVHHEIELSLSQASRGNPCDRPTG